MTTPVCSLSDAEIKKLIQQLQVAYKLKRTLRYSTKRDFSVHSESVAEHVFALFFLLEYFLPLEDPEKTLDVQKIHRMILYHDFGEIVSGDIPYHQKTKSDREKEHAAALSVFALLPAHIQQSSRESWAEYEERSSSEALFVYALDKIEPLFELLHPINGESMKRLHFSHEAHMGVKIRATEQFPYMRRFVEVATKDMLEQQLFWVE